MSTLVIDYTPRPGSRTKTLLEGYLKTVSEEKVVRDLSSTPLPLITENNISNLWQPDSEADFEKISNELTEEVLAAEHIILASPIYNLTVPAQVKAYIDIVAKAGKTFKYTENGPVGLAPFTKATIVTTSGGTAIGSPHDFFTPYLKTFFNFLSAGTPDIEVISATGLDMVEKEKAEEKLAEVISGIK